MMPAFGEFGRGMICGRTRGGLEVARFLGRKCSRAATLDVHAVARANARLRNAGLDVEKAAEEFDIVSLVQCLDVAGGRSDRRGSTR